MDYILDSGAFSAWTRQGSIDIDAYIEFMKLHKDRFTTNINLDVIPGRFGETPTGEEIESAAGKGYENLKYIESKGGVVIPVYHQHEKMYWLEKMIDDGYDYVGISPANDIQNSGRARWLDQVFGLIAKKKPDLKTHGFAVTGYNLMFRYPWFSVDSATWRILGGHGGIYMPLFDSRGEARYEVAPWVLPASGRRGLYEEIPPTIREAVVKYVKSRGFEIGEVEYTEGDDNAHKVGFGLPGGRQSRTRKTEVVKELGLLTKHSERARWNALYFLDLVHIGGCKIPKIIFACGDVNAYKLFRSVYDKYYPGSDRAGVLTSYFYIKGCKKGLEWLQ